MDKIGALNPATGEYVERDATPEEQEAIDARRDAAQAAQNAALERHYDGVVQAQIDGVARSFGYGDPNRPEVSAILHAVGYADEPAVPRFQQEGQTLRAYRSRMWFAAAGIRDAVAAGQRLPPESDAALLAELEAAVPAPVPSPWPSPA